MQLKRRLEMLESTIKKPNEFDFSNMTLDEKKELYSKDLFKEGIPFHDGYMPASEEEYIQRFKALNPDEASKFIEYLNNLYESIQEKG